MGGAGSPSRDGGLKSRILQLERGLVRFETLLLTALLLLMTGLGFLQVILRGVFSSGVLWADPLLRHAVLWVGFLGAAVAAAEEKHFAPEFVDRLISGRWKTAAKLVAALFAGVVCGVLARASWLLILDEYKTHNILLSIGSFHLQAWIVESILPAGFVLLVVHYALKAGIEILELRS